MFPAVVRVRFIFLLVLAATAAAGAWPDSDSLAKRVIVLANSSDPESVRLARYYADKRGVPAVNVIALPTSLVEEITWPVFVSTLYEPLQEELVRRQMIEAIPTDLKDPAGRRKYAISGHHISYLVVCRGVPLKIQNNLALYRPLPPYTDRPEFQTNAGAVDSELSLLAVPNYPLAAFIPNPLYARDRPSIFEESRIVKVSRLDGPSFASALGLVDLALEAEKQGLIGRAYVDLGGPHKVGDAWFKTTADEIAKTDFDLSVDREPSTFPATARFDAPALYFGWYASDLNGPFAQPEFRFPPGAIALHLHSYSARSLNSVYQGWTGPFVARGVTATVGNVYEPFLEFTHQPHLLLRALLRGDTWGDAVYYSVRALSWQAIAIGDPLYRPFARGFSEQWEHRAELPDSLYPYVVLRELHRLEREGNAGQALQLAKQVMAERPNAPVALRMAQLAADAGSTDDARTAARWVAALPVFKPAEVPLAEEAAGMLERAGDAAGALDLYRKLLAQPTLSREFRVQVLERGAKLATLEKRDDLAAAWGAEAVRLSQGG
ncbi:TIGR03790 family protein [Opitutaceae bacterium EW11]|nr:TIGR03790 family protein [Opitutaceae bacterium EW11]